MRKLRRQVCAPKEIELSVLLAVTGARTFEKIPDSLRVPSGARRDVYVGGGRIFLLTTGSGLWMADLPRRK